MARAGLWAALVVSGCGGGRAEPDGGVFDFCPQGSCAPVQGPAFSIVVLPDTQFYADTFHQIFKAQAEWILAQRDARRIAFVVHEGDIVNVDDEGQWRVAAEHLHKLDGKVPYVLSAGNHDYAYKERRISRDCDLLNAHFPAAALAALPWPTGTFEVGRIENQYQVLDAFGIRYLVLGLEYGPRDAVVAWADQVLEQYGGLPAVVVTHAFMARDGKRFETQPFHPCGEGPNEFHDCNDGQMMWDKLIARHDNVVFVFSGHELFPGVSRLTSQRASGRQVHQILANYQTCGGLPCTIPFTDRITEGGDGFLRIVTIDPVRRMADVETFSPYFEMKARDPYRRDPDHQFSLPLDAWQFRPPEPRAAVAFQQPESDRLVVRAPLDRVLDAKPRPRPIEKPACDGIQVILPRVDAVGQPGSARTVQACIDGSCESFTVDDSLACVSDSDQARVTCVNDEGMLRLFFAAGLGPRPLVSVAVDDARGTPLLRATRPIVARRVEGAGPSCWTAVQSLLGNE